MARFTRWVLNHKAAVVVFWVVVAVISTASVNRAVGALSYQFSVPGRAGYETNLAVQRLYGNGGGDPVVPVISLPAGASATSLSVKAQLNTAFAAVQRAIPGSRVVSYGSTGNRAFVSKDGRTTFGLVYAPTSLGLSDPTAGTVQTVLSRFSIDGAHFSVTGTAALSAAPSASGGVGVLGETILGGIGALLVLFFVFRSSLALLPFLMSAVSIPTTFLLVWGLTTVMSVSFIVQFLVGLIGLGVGIDYSLLVVTRWREERGRGVSNEAAVQRAMETAGRSVIFSGTTVAVGLIALVALPVPFLQSVGIGGMLIPLVSVAVALTLLPVLLVTVGPRLDWPAPRSSITDSRFWSAWARGIVARPWVAAAAGITVLGLLVGATSTINIGSPQAASVTATGQARSGLLALQRSGIGAGALTPFEVLVRDASPTRTALAVDRVQGITGTTAPANWQRNGSALVDAFPSADGNSPAGRATLARLRAATDSMPGSVSIGGSVAGDTDFVAATYGNLPLVVGVIVILTFLLLVRAFRSIVLPLKAILLNVVSVGAAWGTMVLVWQDGFGSQAIWGVHATGAITSWIPFTVFSFLFGLSMDYEVFLLTRMREEYDRTGNTETAIVVGVGRTGRLITSAALILFLAFVSLAAAPITDVKVLGTGLGAGILIDATVVRMLLAPALVKLFGQWNWWMPSPVATVFRLQQSTVR
jgi:putative drug exporter of the RND superfamily